MSLDQGFFSKHSAVFTHFVFSINDTSMKRLVSFVTFELIERHAVNTMGVTKLPVCMDAASVVSYVTIKKEEFVLLFSFVVMTIDN